MNGNNLHPLRYETQAIMLADLHVRELRQLAAERSLAARAAASQRPARARRLRLPAWLGLRSRGTLGIAAPIAK